MNFAPNYMKVRVLTLQLVLFMKWLCFANGGGGGCGHDGRGHGYDL